MKKLMLDPESLSVQSFETVAAGQGRGTVLARSSEWWAATCGVNASCAATYCGDCNGTDVNVDCGNQDTNACPSVNIANCESAYYTACCGSGGDRPTSINDWGDWDTPCS